VIKDAPAFAGDVVRKAVELANGRNPLTQPRARPGAAHPLPIVIHACEMGGDYYRLVAQMRIERSKQNQSTKY
jgi:hypothetical protein